MHLFLPFKIFLRFSKSCIFQTTRKTTEKSKIPPNKLPGGAQLPLPTMKPAVRKNFVDEEIKRIGLNLEPNNNKDPWSTAKEWLKPRSVYPTKHQALGSILSALTSNKVKFPRFRT